MKKEIQIVFRYKRELLTLYNSSVKKFLKALYSVTLIVIGLTFVNNREKFYSEYFYYILALIILVAFGGYIYYRTRQFAKYVAYFVRDNKRIKGKIIDVVTEREGQKNRHFLKIQYLDPKNGLTTFISDEVTGNPYRLLKSNVVSVYARGGKAFASDFDLAENFEESIMGKESKEIK